MIEVEVVYNFCTICKVELKTDAPLCYNCNPYKKMKEIKITECKQSEFYLIKCKPEYDVDSSNFVILRYSGSMFVINAIGQCLNPDAVLNIYTLPE